MHTYEFDHGVRRVHCCSSSVEIALAEELPKDSAEAAVEVGEYSEVPAQDDVEAGDTKCAGTATADAFRPFSAQKDIASELACAGELPPAQKDIAKSASAGLPFS